MKNKTKIYFLFVVFIVAVVVQGGVLYGTSRQMAGSIQFNKLANELVKGIFELNILTNGYILTREDRGVERWELRYESLRRYFNSEVYKLQRSPEEGDIFEAMSREYLDLGNIFRNLVEPEISKELERGLVGQILVKSQRIVNDALQLSELSNKKVLSVQERGGYFNVLSLLLFLIIIVIGARIIISSARAIEKLIELAEIISKGNLMIELDSNLKKRKDEAGQLANALSLMILGLQKSRANIEKKVAERTTQLKEFNRRMVGREIKMIELKRALRRARGKRQNN